MALVKAGTPRDSYAYRGEDDQLVFGSALVDSAVTEVDLFRLLRGKVLSNLTLFLSIFM